MQSATATDATPGNKTSAEEPWATAYGERYKARVWEDLRNLFQQDELTDVMLAAEGQSIPCHRVLLAAASRFFHGKFVINPESVEHNLLDIEDIDFDTLTSVLFFIYNGRADLTVEKTEKLIPASVSLMLPELTNMCKNFLLHKVKNDVSSCINIHRIAKANSLSDVGEKAWQVMLEKFQDLTGTDAFNEMPETELREYIRDDGLNVANEDPVFEAVVTWVRHNVENRKSSFENLMENITLSHCSPSFLGNVVRIEPLINTAKFLQELARGLYHHASLSPLQRGTARKGHRNFNSVMAIFEDHCWTLEDGESEWIRRLSLSRQKLKYSSCCSTEGGILITGGRIQEVEPSGQCWKLSIPRLTWFECATS